MPIDQNILIEASGQHPAHTMPFDTLYAGLMQEVSNGNVNVLKNAAGELELFSYTQDCQFSGNWNVFSLISRGLILCPSEKSIIASPFIKFINWGEGGYSLPNEEFSTTVKMDGSLAIIFNFHNDWQVATRGSFKSEQAIWAKDWIYKNINRNGLMIGDTYLAEIIYRENRIVVPYDFEGLVMLSAYDRQGFELPYGEVGQIAKDCGMRITEMRSFTSVDDIIKIAESLPHTEEGFVVRFESGYRIKIKSTEYCRVHNLISNVRPLHVWECMINGDDMDGIYKQLPEELRIDFANIREILEEQFERKMFQLSAGCVATKNLNDKELGLHIVECREHGFIHTDIANPFVADNLFLCRKRNLLETVHVKGSKERNRVFKYFRPKNDVLARYVPTNAMNRFTAEEDS